MEDFLYVGIAIGVALTLSVVVLLALVYLLCRVCGNVQQELRRPYRQRPDESSRTFQIDDGNKEGPTELQTFVDRSTSCSLSYPHDQPHSCSMSPSISSVESGQQLILKSKEDGVVVEYVVDVSRSSRLGSGHAGVVYKAHDRRSGNFAAVKVIDRHRFADDDSIFRFDRETSVMKALSAKSVHFVKLLAKQVTDKHFLIAMEYCELGDLSQWHRTFGPQRNIAWMTRWAIILQTRYQIACTLEELHRSKIFHRDIKPQNILVSRQPPQYMYAGCRSWKDLFALFGEPLGSTAMPEFGAVKIGDFGISRFANSDGQASTAGVGTPVYMAPEVQRGNGNYGPECDAYSFGVMFKKDLDSIEFESPTEALQEQRGMEGMVKIRDRHVGSWYELDPEFSRIVNGFLEEDPSKRSKLRSFIEAMDMKRTALMASREYNHGWDEGPSGKFERGKKIKKSTRIKRNSAGHRSTSK